MNFTLRVRCCLGISALFAMLPVVAAPALHAQTGVNGNGRILAGYWHDWETPVWIPLGSVPSSYDIIVVAFANYNGSGNFSFTVDPAETQAQFISDIKSLHAQGKKVLVSLGGASETPTLGSSADAQNFATSAASIVQQFGFDGIDIDFENGAVYLNENDTNINAPTTPSVVYLIDGLKQFHSTLPNAMVTMAPIANYLQAGYQYYGPGPYGDSNWNGAQLPVIQAISSFLSYVWPQYYNECNIEALDNNLYCEGTDGNLVAMSEMIMKGFPAALGAGNFTPLAQSKVLMGVPASSSASPGYLSNSDLEASFNYLMTGKNQAGTYTLTNPAGYPNTAGFMTWSINWDVYSNNGALGTGIHAYLASLPPVQGSCTPTTIVPEIWTSTSGTWTQESSVTVASGTTVDLSPQPTTGGSWSWTGPNGFTSTSREIDNIPLSTGVNTYVATYTNASGCKSSQTFTITVTSAPSFTLSDSPSSLSIKQGASGSSTITVASSNGYNSAVSLSVSGLPAGVTASFSSGSVTPPANGSATSTLTLTAGTTAAAGTASVTITGIGGSLTKTSTVSLTVTSSGGGGGAFGGTPAAVPGTVMAENYDTGGQGVAYNVTAVNGTANGYRSDGVDLEPATAPATGNNLGWTAAGQWFKYTVNVAAAGSYKVSFLVAGNVAVADAFHLASSSGTNLTGAVSVPATGGWQKWTTVTATVTLPAGTQTLTLDEDAAGWNIDSIAFAASGGNGEGPFGGTPAAVPGTAMAENYDTGGQGVGYNVAKVNGTANGYRSDGVDLESATAPATGNNLGWTAAGQWFRYTVNVSTAGTYTVSFLVAGDVAVADGFHLSNSAGTNLTGAVSVPATGGWQKWTTVTATVTLPAGVQTLTLAEDNAGWNIDSMAFTF
jgi:chitinase